MNKPQEARRTEPQVTQPLVKDLMTKEVLTLTKEDSVKALRDIFELKRVRHVPITNDDNGLIGLVTQRDFLTIAVSKFAHFDRAELDEIYGRIKIGEIMGKKVATVIPDTPLGEAADLMYRHKYGCLPVVSEGRLVGIITEGDFVRAFARAFARSQSEEDCCGCS